MYLDYEVMCLNYNESLIILWFFSLLLRLKLPDLKRKAQQRKDVYLQREAFSLCNRRSPPGWLICSE